MDVKEECLTTAATSVVVEEEHSARKTNSEEVDTDISCDPRRVGSSKNGSSKESKKKRKKLNKIPEMTSFFRVSGNLPKKKGGKKKVEN